MTDTILTMDSGLFTDMLLDLDLPKGELLKE